MSKTAKTRNSIGLFVSFFCKKWFSRAIMPLPLVKHEKSSKIDLFYRFLLPGSLKMPKNLQNRPFLQVFITRKPKDAKKPPKSYLFIAFYQYSINELPLTEVAISSKIPPFLGQKRRNQWRFFVKVMFYS